jgi:hypothetical protein
MKPPRKPAWLRPSPRARPIRAVQRERRVDSDRRDRAQPAPLDRTDRPARQHRAPSSHQPPTDARDARPAHPPQPTVDPAPPGTLALENRLARRAEENPRAPDADLTADTRASTVPGVSAAHHAAQNRTTASAGDHRYPRHATKTLCGTNPHQAVTPNDPPNRQPGRSTRPTPRSARKPEQPGITRWIEAKLRDRR